MWLCVIQITEFVFLEMWIDFRMKRESLKRNKSYAGGASLSIFIHPNPWIWDLWVYLTQILILWISQSAVLQMQPEPYSGHVQRPFYGPVSLCMASSGLLKISTSSFHPISRSAIIVLPEASQGLFRIEETTYGLSDSQKSILMQPEHSSSHVRRTAGVEDPQIC